MKSTWPPLEELHALIRQRVDSTRLMRDTESIWRTELKQTFDAYHASARLVEGLLRETGCTDVERIAFPADGKSAFLDRTQPLGWFASRARLELLENAPDFDSPVLADFERHPFHLIKGSVATPPDGLETHLVSEEDFHAGADVRQKLVLLNPEERPMSSKLRMVCEAGAMGLVTDNLAGRFEHMDALQWVNACTGGKSWHIRADDPPFVGFVVTPRTGDRLRALLRRDSLRQTGARVRVFCDGERREDKIEVVTGVIPGEVSEELWLMAHLYEPLADDNSSGVACALEIARVLHQLYETNTLLRPRFTLRLVFAMESYGFAAYAVKRGTDLGPQVVGALNLDGLPIVRGDQAIRLSLSQSGCPSPLDYLLEQLVQPRPQGLPPVVEIECEGEYSDDRVLADSTTGVPTLWLRAVKLDCPRSSLTPRRPWHNSIQTMEHLDARAFHASAALFATWTAAALGPDAADLRYWLQTARRTARRRLEDATAALLQPAFLNQPDPGRESSPLQRLEHRMEMETARLNGLARFGVDPAEIRAAIDELAGFRAALGKQVAARLPQSDPRNVTAFSGDAWRLADNIRIGRKSAGLVHDLAEVPREERKRSMSSTTGGPLALALVHADGKRSLAELLLRAQAEEGKLYPETVVRKCIGDLQFLARHGYVDFHCATALKKSDILKALRMAGVREGDLLLVHCSLSSMGVVEGGAETIIDALLEALGPEGTLLMPTFTRSILCFDRGPARRPGVVPFHPERTPTHTGVIAETFRKRKGVLRSLHPSHSICGLGPLAGEYLSAHGPTDAPCGPTSPWSALVERKGKMVWVGAGLQSCTFLHYLEDAAGVDYLTPAICLVEDDDGSRRLVPILNHVGGRRNFYRKDPEQAEIFRRLSKDGLRIESATCGRTQLKLIEAEPFHKLGLELLRQQPHILL